MTWLIGGLTQDGGDIYDAAGACVWSAPFRVTDHDMPAAERARAMFVEWCRRVRGVEPRFAGASDDVVVIERAAVIEAVARLKATQLAGAWSIARRLEAALGLV